MNRIMTILGCLCLSPALLAFITEHPWTADPTDVAGTEFAEVVSAAGDVNGDGFGDVLARSNGRVYVFHGSASGPSTHADWSFEILETGSSSRNVAAAGDVNGDTYDDIIVGSPQWTDGSTKEGRAYVFYGSETGLAAAPSWTADPTNEEDSRFGEVVASAGDVDDDGYDDVIVSAPRLGAADTGMVYVYYGSDAGLPGGDFPTWTASPFDQADARFGATVDGVGDVNDDGYDDIIASNCVYYGSQQLLTFGDTPDWTVTVAGFAGAYAGGDLNGDGLGDVVVHLYDSGWGFQIFHGASGGLTSATSPSLEVSCDGCTEVAAAGNVNGDGFDDLIVGKPEWGLGVSGQGEYREGQVLVLYGSVTGVAADFGDADFVADGADQEEANFGTSVALAGDVNGDTFGDIIVGAPGWSSEQGRAYVYLGSDDGLWRCRDDDTTCDPVDDDCDGELNEDYVPLECGQGHCLSTCTPSSCDPSGIETDCVPGAPLAAEDTTCDGIDDDCADGADEDYVVLVTDCGVGACARQGETSCVDATVLDSCVTGTAEHTDDTTCDGIDDNCNGANDEDYAPFATACGVGYCAATGTTSCVDGSQLDSCATGTPLHQQDTSCDGVDDDCDGTADDDYVSLRCGVGHCEATCTPSSCSGGVETACVPGSLLSSQDNTCDAVDDNCDGSVDEAWSAQVTCGQGVCQRDEICEGAAGTSCTPGEATEAADITCDGEDGDCDGDVDEDFGTQQITCGVGACENGGVRTCVNGAEVDQCTPGMPAPEDASCDNVDNDCSGEVDEDYVGEETTCGEGACKNTGVSVCVNGVVEDGCSPLQGGKDDTKCNGIDDDCDGTVDDGAICGENETCEKGKCKSLQQGCGCSSSAGPLALSPLLGLLVLFAFRRRSI